MNYLSVGVIGHVDHGKTSLVKALTGVDTDRLKEEKERGISIALGFADLVLPGGRIAFVDAPGHERFVRTMVAGATGIQAVLLVVDVNEGVKPQTIEHIEIASLLGIGAAVVAITKCDTADDDLYALAAAEIEEFLEESGLDSVAIVKTSSVSGEGIDAVRDALEALLVESGKIEDEGFAYLPIDRAFSMKGFGTVVTGTLRRGSLSEGDAVTIYPQGIEATVRQLQSHGDSVSTALPGRRTAVNLRNIDKDDLKRGDAVAYSGSLERARFLDVELQVLPGAPKALRQRQAVRVLFGTTEALGRLHLLDGDTLAPGARCVCQVCLDAPVAFLAREPFIVRSYSPMRTLGGGRILGGTSSRRKRRGREAIDALETLSRGDAREILTMDLREAEPGALEVKAFGVRRRFSADSVEAALDAVGCVDVSPGWVVAGDHLRRVEEELRGTLESFHQEEPLAPGLTLDELTARSSGPLDGDVAGCAVKALRGAGTIAIEEGRLRLASHSPGAGMSVRDAELRDEIEEAFRAAGLEPPGIAESVGQDRDRQRLYRYLLDTGVLVRTFVANKPRTAANTIVFHAEHVEGAQASLARAFGEAGRFDTGGAKGVLGVSRKYLIPLLECLDARGFCRRSGSERVIVAK